MSNEPMLKQVAAQLPAAEARSDAEKMEAALLRMRAAARQPEAVERLRAELDEMREVIANIRAALLSDSDPSALLDDLDARTGRVMAAVIAGSLPAEKPAAALPAETPAATLPTEALAPAQELPPAQELAPVQELAPEAPPERPFDEQALLDALGDESPVAAHAEPDRVPTVSGVYSQLGLAHDPGVEAPPGQTTTVAMLESMVEELAASMPAAEAAAEAVSLPPSEPSEPAPAPVAAVSETEPVVVIEAAAPEPVLEPAPEPETFAPDEPMVIEAPDPVAAVEAPAPQDQPQDQLQDHTAAAPPEQASPAEQEPVPAADASLPSGPEMPEVELLSSFAMMETMPFLPPEVGTAVIFESRVKSDTTAEGLSAQQAEPAATVAPQPAALPEPVVIMPPVDLFEPSGPETSPQPDTPPEQTLQASATPAPETSAEPVADLDLDVLLFETQFEADDPAATLLEPAWPAQDWPAQDVRSAAPASAPAAAQSAAQQPQDKPADPLGPLKAMSDEERIALFE